MVLIAPAVDFTEALMWARASEAERRAIVEEGVWERPSAYSDEPYRITRGLIEDGRRHLLLGQTVRSYCPTRILQGMRDEDVPYRHALTLVEHMAGDPVTLTPDQGRRSSAVATAGPRRCCSKRSTLSREAASIAARAEAVQTGAVDPQPRLGALGLGEEAARQFPERRRMVHVDDVRDFVRGEIVENIRRRENQPPGKIQPARRGARAPAARGVAQGDAARRDAEPLGVTRDRRLDVLARLALEEIGDAARDMRLLAG